MDEFIDNKTERIEGSEPETLCSGRVQGGTTKKDHDGDSANIADALRKSEIVDSMTSYVWPTNETSELRHDKGPSTYQKKYKSSPAWLDEPLRRSEPTQLETSHLGLRIDDIVRFPWGLMFELRCRYVLPKASPSGLALFQGAFSPHTTAPQGCETGIMYNRQPPPNSGSVATDRDGSGTDEFIIYRKKKPSRALVFMQTDAQDSFNCESVVSTLLVATDYGVFFGCLSDFFFAF